MNASLSMGTLQGSIITCPLHFSRFDVITGKNLSGPVEPRMEGMDSLPPALIAYATRVAELQAPIRVHELEKFPVRVDGPKVFVDI
jgi:nitrite reductase/ring-hydroxylating ferredoxin subunit